MDDEFESTKIFISQSVSEEKISERIQSLKSQLLILNSEVQSLVLKDNPLFIEMAKSYNKLKENDLNNVEKWNENSKRMAQIQYDNEIQTDEDDFNINKEKVDLRAKMLIKYKFEKLSKTEPEIAEYFRKFDLPFLDQIGDVPSFPDDDLSDAPISFTKEPLLNFEEASQDLSILSQRKPKTTQYVVTQKSLKYGKTSFQAGWCINVILPGKPPINAIIQSISHRGITFKVKDSDDIFTISLLALNSGFVTLEKM